VRAERLPGAVSPCRWGRAVRRERDVTPSSCQYSIDCPHRVRIEHKGTLTGPSRVVAVEPGLHRVPELLRVPSLLEGALHECQVPVASGLHRIRAGRVQRHDQPREKPRAVYLGTIPRGTYPRNQMRVRVLIDKWNPNLLRHDAPQKAASRAAVRFYRCPDLLNQYLDAAVLLLAPAIGRLRERHRCPPTDHGNLFLWHAFAQQDLLDRVRATYGQHYIVIF